MPHRLRVFVLPAVLAVAACGQESTPQRPLTNGGEAGSGSAAGSAIVPAAGTGPIALAAATRHAVLELTLTNTTADPVEIATHVIGGEVDNYDWLTVDVAAAGGGGATRTLHFMTDRKESGIETATLAPGAAHVARIDLVQWAVEGPLADPLGPGTYTVTARWDTSQTSRGAQFAATATTTLVIEPPGAEGCGTKGYKTPAGASLLLLAHQARTGRATVNVGLYNAGDAAVCVYSYIQTHEIQYDWLTIQYADGGKYHHASRVIQLDDAREKSYPVSALLGPGQTIWHSIDADAWAKRSRNGSEVIPKGSLYAQAAYDSTRETDVWADVVRSRPFELLVK